MSEPENFLTRWSRRKQQGAQEDAPSVLPRDPPTLDSSYGGFESAEARSAKAESGDPESQYPAENAALDPHLRGEDRGESGDQQVAKQEQKEPEVDLTKLPSLDSIAADTDITGFLQRGVPSDLSRAALRRAWAADPAIRDFIGIAENQYDFATGDGIPGFGPLNAADNVARMVADIAREGFRALEPTEAERTADNAETPAEPDHSTVAASPQPEATEPPAEGQDGSAAAPGEAAEDIVHRNEVNVAMQQNSSDPEYSPLPTRRPHGRALPE